MIFVKQEICENYGTLCCQFSYVVSFVYTFLWISKNIFSLNLILILELSSKYKRNCMTISHSVSSNGGRCLLFSLFATLLSNLHLSFLKMHPAIKINKSYHFKKIKTVEPLRREDAKGYIYARKSKDWRATCVGDALTWI